MNSQAPSIFYELGTARDITECAQRHGKHPGSPHPVAIGFYLVRLRRSPSLTRCCRQTQRATPHSTHAPHTAPSHTPLLALHVKLMMWGPQGSVLRAISSLLTFPLSARPGSMPYDAISYLRPRPHLQMPKCHCPVNASPWISLAFNLNAPSTGFGTLSTCCPLRTFTCPQWQTHPWAWRVSQMPSSKPAANLGVIYTPI